MNKIGLVIKQFIAYERVFNVRIIFGKPFLAMFMLFVDMQIGKMMFQLNDK